MTTRFRATYSPWVFPDSSNFMVCTDGEDGGNAPKYNLYPAFDLPDEDGGVHWCVRQKLLGGDSSPVAEVFDGAAVDVMAGLVVDGRKLGEGDADDMAHEFAGYLATLFAKAPAMRDFIDDVAHGNESRNRLRERAANLLHDIYTTYKNDGYTQKDVDEPIEDPT